MKNRFIRIVSPISVAMALILDTAVIYYAYYAYRRLSQELSFINTVFAIIELCSIALAIFYSREVLRHGIRFKEGEFEITALDENNIYKYSDIESVEVFKDLKASLKKNFVDRYSRLTIKLKDGTIATIELGLTTKRKLNKIENEINARIKNQAENE